MIKENLADKGYYSSKEIRELGFKKIGNNVKIAKNCRIVGIENISIGNNVRIDDYVILICAEGYLKIGSYIHIGSHTHIACGGGVVLNDFCGLSQGVRLYSSSDDYSGISLTNPTVPKEFLNVKKESINLAKHVIIGSGSIVLPGISIGEGSCVGALSLVNKSLGAWAMYFGSPVKKIGSRKKNLLELEKQLIEKIGNSLPKV